MLNKFQLFLGFKIATKLTTSRDNLRDLDMRMKKMTMNENVIEHVETII